MMNVPSCHTKCRFTLCWVCSLSKVRKPPAPAWLIQPQVSFSVHDSSVNKTLIIFRGQMVATCVYMVATCAEDSRKTWRQSENVQFWIPRRSMRSLQLRCSRPAQCPPAGSPPGPQLLGNAVRKPPTLSSWASILQRIASSALAAAQPASLGFLHLHGPFRTIKDHFLWSQDHFWKHILDDPTNMYPEIWALWQDRLSQCS